MRGVLDLLSSCFNDRDEEWSGSSAMPRGTATTSTFAQENDIARARDQQQQSNRARDQLACMSRQLAEMTLDRDATQRALSKLQRECEKIDFSLKKMYTSHEHSLRRLDEEQRRSNTLSNELQAEKRAHSASQARLEAAASQLDEATEQLLAADAERESLRAARDAMDERLSRAEEALSERREREGLFELSCAGTPERLSVALTAVVAAARAAAKVLASHPAVKQASPGKDGHLAFWRFSLARRSPASAALDQPLGFSAVKALLEAALCDAALSRGVGSADLVCDCTGFADASAERAHHNAIAHRALEGVVPEAEPRMFKEMPDAVRFLQHVQRVLYGWAGPGYSSEGRVIWEAILSQQLRATMMRLSSRAFLLHSLLIACPAPSQLIRRGHGDGFDTTFCEHVRLGSADLARMESASDAASLDCEEAEWVAVPRSTRLAVAATCSPGLRVGGKVLERARVVLCGGGAAREDLAGHEAVRSATLEAKFGRLSI